MADIRSKGYENEFEAEQAIRQFKLRLVLQRVLDVKAVPPSDQRTTDLTDLLIIGENEVGDNITIRINDYLSSKGGYSKIQKYYDD